ncbi:putative phage abortive infection protein [Enterobacter hormaechei subsp. steigerwaltii]|uniref:putative phage abortive infection protein n=1 Tax=Enterobacter hormaechei TaxID=158836 RepID=UPI003F433B81
MKNHFPIWIGVVSVASVIGYAVFLIFFSWPITSISEPGVFGDSFGVLTSLFSALAFVCVVWTLNYQREEFKLQKQELAESKKEIAKQGFENSFFQMLKIQNDIVEGITYEKIGMMEKDEFKGRDALKELSIKLHSQIKSLAKNAIDLDRVKHSYEALFNEDGHRLAHYFRFLYNIFRFLSEADIDNKMLYARLVRAQISNQELFLLYYNSLTPAGRKFQNYIHEFNLMDNLLVNELVCESHQDFLPEVNFYRE